MQIFGSFPSLENIGHDPAQAAAYLAQAVVFLYKAGGSVFRTRLAPMLP